MSPVIGTEDAHQLEARLLGSCSGFGYSYRNGYCQRSRFSSWGRWVLVGVLVFAVLCVLLFCT